MNEAQRAFEKWHKRKFPEIPVEWQEHLGRYFYGPVQTRWEAYAAAAADALESLLGDMQHDKCGCLCYDSCPKCKIIAAIRARQEQEKEKQ